MYPVSCWQHCCACGMNVQLNSLRADLASIMSQTYADEIRKYEKNLQDSMDSIQRDQAAYLQLRSAAPGLESEEGKALMARIADLSQQESKAREGIIKGVLDGRRGVANVAFDKKYRPVFQELGETYGKVVHMNVTGSKAAAQSATDAGQKTRNMSIKNISAMNKRFIEIDTSLLPSLIELQEMHLKFWIIRSDVLALISQTSPTEIERYSSNITSTMDSIRENHDRYFAIVGESEDQHHAGGQPQYCGQCL